MLIVMVLPLVLIIIIYRLLRSPLPRPESTVMLNVTLLPLTFSMGKSSKILSHLPTIVMYGLSRPLPPLTLILLSPPRFSFNYELFFGLQVPHVNRTDYQLIDISEDGFVSLYLWLVDWFFCKLNYVALFLFHCCRWVCSLTMVIQRMIWSFQLMRLFFHRFVYMITCNTLVGCVLSCLSFICNRRFVHS